MKRRKYKRGQIEYMRKRRRIIRAIRWRLALMAPMLTPGDLDSKAEDVYRTIWAMQQGFRLKIDLKSGIVSW